MAKQKKGGEWRACLPMAVLCACLCFHCTSAYGTSKEDSNLRLCMLQKGEEGNASHAATCNAPHSIGRAGSTGRCLQ